MVSTSFLEAETFTVFISASVISDWSTFTEVKFEVLLKNLSWSNSFSAVLNLMTFLFLLSRMNSDSNSTVSLAPKWNNLSLIAQDSNVNHRIKNCNSGIKNVWHLLPNIPIRLVETQGLQLNELGLIKTVIKTDRDNLLEFLASNGKNLACNDCLCQFDLIFFVELP